MPNFIVGNTYVITDSSATALAWSSGAHVNNVVFFALNTLASASFIIGANSPILSWNLITHGAVSLGSSAAVLPSTHVVPMGGTYFRAAWIPTTLTACTAWVNFA